MAYVLVADLAPTLHTHTHSELRKGLNINESSSLVQEKKPSLCHHSPLSLYPSCPQLAHLPTSNFFTTLPSLLYPLSLPQSSHIALVFRHPNVPTYPRPLLLLAISSL